MKMNSTPITRGSTSSAFLLTKGLLFAAGSAFSFWSAVSRGNYMAAFAGTMFLGLSVWNLVSWTSFRRGQWRIDWDGHNARIWNGDQIDFDGDVSGMYQIDQDGRGYYLYPTRDTVFRLRRGHTSDAFEALLNNIQEAQQDAPSNGGQRPSLNSSFPSRRG